MQASYYQEMLQNAARYEGMEIRRMSRLTENLLEQSIMRREDVRERKIIVYFPRHFRQNLFLPG